MSEERTESIFEFDLGDHGDRLHFASPHELDSWNSHEIAKWQWLDQSPHGNQIRGQHQNLHNQVTQHAGQWRNHEASQQPLVHLFNALRSTFEQFYKGQMILNSTAPKGGWLLKLQQERGAIIAVGAYAALLGRDLQNTINQPQLIEGMIEGFLFTREIDWTASAHHEALNRLKSQYEGNISDQDTRFKVIEQQNTALNESFQIALKEKKSALDELHAGQTTEFQRLTEEHVANLKAIEQTYDQKLALQKPVEYWEDKGKYHGVRSKWFGISSLIVGIGLAGLLGWLAHWVFGNLPQGENPKQWQIAIFLVAAFFAIWLTRILVRLFLSHLHLATDAAERSTMILTYLSMAREGSQFAPEDKTLIVQHLFRSVSDGLVKDDAAPPSLFEFMTRK